MRTITLANVKQLLNDFEQTGTSISMIQSSFQIKIQSYLASSDLIKPDAFEELTAYKKTLDDLLSYYTADLLRFTRSVAKAKPEERPDEEFMNKVRDTRLKAEQILSDFQWNLDYVKQKINLHNMTLGDFHTVYMTTHEAQNVVDESASPSEEMLEDSPEPASDSAPASTPEDAPEAAEAVSGDFDDPAVEITTNR